MAIIRPVIEFLAAHRLVAIILGALAGAAMLWTTGAVSQGAPDLAGTVAGGVAGAGATYAWLHDRGRERH